MAVVQFSWVMQHEWSEDTSAVAQGDGGSLTAFLLLCENGAGAT